MINSHKIKPVDEIALFLIGAGKPVPETNLMRYAFDLKDIPFSGRDLFEKHFILFHSLYEIKRVWGVKGFYLHLHPLRIRLVKTAGGCPYYFPEDGIFCGEPLLNGVCPHHPLRKPDNCPEYDCVRSFYEDESNIEWGGYDKMERIRKGFSIYSCRFSDVKAALSFFGFSSAAPSGYSVRKRYWELAREMHPDRGGHPDDMKRLNESYDLLKSVFAV